MQPRCSPCKQDKVLIGCAWPKKKLDKCTLVACSLELSLKHFNLQSQTGQRPCQDNHGAFLPRVALSIRSEYLWIRQAPQFLWPAPKVPNYCNSAGIWLGSMYPPEWLLSKDYNPLLSLILVCLVGNTESFSCLLLTQRLPNILIPAMLTWTKSNRYGEGWDWETTAVVFFFGDFEDMRLANRGHCCSRFLERSLPSCGNEAWGVTRGRDGQGAICWAAFVDPWGCLEIPTCWLWS